MEQQTVELPAANVAYMLNVIRSSQYPLVPGRDMKAFVQMMDEVEDKLKELNDVPVVQDDPVE